MQTSGYMNEGQTLAAAPILVAEVANTEKVTGAVDMASYRRVLFIFVTGDMAAQTVDFRVESDTDSGFATAKATVKSATQLAAHATNNDSKYVQIEVNGSELASGHRYVRGRAIGGNATTGPVCIIPLGQPYATNSPGNHASLVETK